MFSLLPVISTSRFDTAFKERQCHRESTGTLNKLPEFQPKSGDSGYIIVVLRTEQLQTPGSKIDYQIQCFH